jgi:hypothetical protein
LGRFFDLPRSPFEKLSAWLLLVPGEVKAAGYILVGEAGEEL